MKEKQEIKIKYRSGVSRFKDKNGFEHKEFEYDYISAERQSVKRYRGALMLLAGIDGCEKNLMEWLEDNMTSGNYVSNNEVTRRSFMNFYEKHKKKNYADKTISIAFQRLSEATFLIPMTRGTFMVNPILYYAGDEDSRIKAIKMVMEFKSGVDTKITAEAK